MPEKILTFSLTGGLPIDGIRREASRGALVEARVRAILPADRPADGCRESRDVAVKKIRRRRNAAAQLAISSIWWLR
jgi:hypothetical protein